MGEPIFKYISLKNIYQMNPPKFIFDMLKRIEKRNLIQVKKNMVNENYIAYGITHGEYDMIERFKNGTLGPRHYSSKNENFDRELNKVLSEGLNLPKTHVEDIPLTSLERDNLGVVKHFFDMRISSRIATSWGTNNLKINKYHNGFGLMNYSTLLAWRDSDNNIYINNQKYSRSTTKIQNNILRYAKESKLNGVIGTVPEDEIYKISGIGNETKYYPYDDRELPRLKLDEGLNLPKSNVGIADEGYWDFKHILYYFKQIANHFKNYQVDFQDQNVGSDHIDMIISVGDLDFGLNWDNSDRFGGEINIRVLFYDDDGQSDNIGNYDINYDSDYLPEDHNPVKHIINIIDSEISNNSETYQGSPTS
jgi:hypothetical protein